MRLNELENAIESVDFTEFLTLMFKRYFNIPVRFLIQTNDEFHIISYKDDKTKFLHLTIYILSQSQHNTFISYEYQANYQGNFEQELTKFLKFNYQYINFDHSFTNTEINFLNKFLFTMENCNYNKKIFLTALKYRQYSNDLLEIIVNMHIFDGEEEKQFWFNCAKYQRLSKNFIQKYYLKHFNTPKIALALKSNKNELFKCSEYVITYIQILSSQLF